MSTTFEVWPTTKDVPSYAKVIEIASSQIAALLADYAIPFDSRMCVEVRNNKHESQGIEAADLINWRGEGYSWFYFEHIAGGTDAYFELVDEIDRQCWEEEAIGNDRIRTHLPAIRESLDQGHYWTFRRSAGQPAIVNLAHGFLASAVADLTNGLVHSFDSAWDYERMPCTSGEFCRYWFRPEHGLSEDTRSWYRRCLDSLRLSNKRAEQADAGSRPSAGA